MTIATADIVELHYISLVIRESHCRRLLVEDFGVANELYSTRTPGSEDEQARLLDFGAFGTGVQRATPVDEAPTNDFSILIKITRAKAGVE